MIAAALVNFLDTTECVRAAFTPYKLKHLADIWKSIDEMVLDYMGKHLISHIDGAEKYGTAQDGVIDQLAEDECARLLRLRRLRLRRLRLRRLRLRPGLYPTPIDLESSILMKFISERCFHATRRVLAMGADCTIPFNNQGDTPLHYAVTIGPEMVALLLRQPVNINAQAKDGQTPLHRVELNVNNPSECIMLIEILLAHGARADNKDGWGRLPLDCAMDQIIWIRDLGRYFSESRDKLNEDSEKVLSLLRE
jgi:hypothetical protein